MKKICNRNIGRTDRIIRLVIGIPLTLWGIYEKNWWAVLGIILIVTAIFAHCSVYSWFKIITRKNKKQPKV